jgi:multimeric flavodoxin WrbA
MKVVAFNGSARKGGNTAIMVRRLFDELEKQGIETELVELAGRKIHGCIACYKCWENKDQRCAVKNDDLNECLEKMLKAQGIILASPTYFADVTSEMKALIDRAGMTSMANDRMLGRKAGAAVVVARRGGAIHTFDTINHFFAINRMIVPGSTYWNMGYGRDPGEVTGDQEALDNMTDLGDNLAWLLKKLYV